MGLAVFNTEVKVYMAGEQAVCGAMNESQGNWQPSLVGEEECREAVAGHGVVVDL